MVAEGDDDAEYDAEYDNEEEGSELFVNNESNN